MVATGARFFFPSPVFFSSAETLAETVGFEDGEALDFDPGDFRGVGDSGGLAFERDVGFGLGDGVGFNSGVSPGEADATGCKAGVGLGEVKG
jgi:hypothetical protein